MHIYFYFQKALKAVGGKKENLSTKNLIVHEIETGEKITPTSIIDLEEDEEKTTETSEDEASKSQINSEKVVKGVRIGPNTSTSQTIQRPSTSVFFVNKVN